MHEWWQWLAMVAIFVLSLCALFWGWHFVFLGALAVGGRLQQAAHPRGARPTDQESPRR